MTTQQKYIVTRLMEGGSITGTDIHGYRLRDADHIVLIRFTAKSFHKLKSLLRYQKGFWLINKNKVRSLHGKHFAKKLYKKLVNPATYCEPCYFSIPSLRIKTVKRNQVFQVVPETQLSIF